MDSQQSPLITWLNKNSGNEISAIDLLSSLLVGVAFVSGIGGDNQDLYAHYTKLVKSAFSGLYDSGESENFSDELISVAYTHLTGENFEDLQEEWSADTEMALAQNRALIDGE